MTEAPPSFARDFPRSPELDEAVAAFAQGDYRRARALASRLRSATPREDVRRAAAEVVLRTRPDPTAVALLVLTALMLLAIGTYWMVYGKPPPQQPPGAPRIHRAEGPPEPPNRGGPAR